uniref:Uncharacterized protein n=1 Tax=Anguilla anguilla TaxID=7936 RepID=A0A0E9XUW2_ANGAN
MKDIALFKLNLDVYFSGSVVVTYFHAETGKLELLAHAAHFPDAARTQAMQKYMPSALSHTG